MKNEDPAKIHYNLNLKYYQIVNFRKDWLHYLEYNVKVEKKKNEDKKTPINEDEK